jgi:hypothetical protein
VEKLKEKGLAWVPKRSVQAQMDGAAKIKEKKENQEVTVKLEVCTKSPKLLVMASSILSAHVYEEFIPRYA